MPGRVLTDISVRNLQPQGERQIDVYDSKVRGLAVRVSPKGTKAFIVWYRVGRKARRLTLGRFPTMSLAEARKRASQALIQVADGKDPAAEKQRARADYGALLFAALAEEFIQLYAKRHTKSWRETEAYLNREFVTQWAKWPIQTISRHDVTKVLNAIVDRGSPSTANHALAAVRKMFNWAVERGHLSSSPCLGVKAPSKTNSRDRVLSDAELVRVWLAAEKMGWPYGRMVQLLILTGQRRNEVMGMRWSELDLAKAVWTIPAARTKAGRTHDLPLSTEAVKVITALPQAHEDLVFPAKGKDTSASGFLEVEAAA